MIRIRALGLGILGEARSLLGWGPAAATLGDPRPRLGPLGRHDQKMPTGNEGA